MPLYVLEHYHVETEMGPLQTADTMWKVTEMVVFRKGGRLAQTDKIYCRGVPLRKKNFYKYLGITVQLTGKTFTVHIQERLNAAVRSISDIEHLQRISLKTAMRLFDAKIVPTLTYGIEIIWECLTVRQLQDIERLKATYLKRAMGVSKYTSSRLVYILARETFLLEDIRLSHLLPETPAVKEVLQERRRKEEDVWSKFYTTDAVLYRDWTQANYELRHIVTRFVVHGFHHKLCTNKHFHKPSPQCVCGNECEGYHVLTCDQRHDSLTKFCSAE